MTEPTKLIERSQEDEMLYYIDANGNYLGAANGDNPYGGEPVFPPPEYGDQVWLFSDAAPYWSESPSLAATRENSWRDEQMPKAEQTVTAIQYGEEGILGTAQQWQRYWLALRKWSADNPEFPDSNKRPMAPS